MILITGATGRIGREVVKLASTGGDLVRALVRDPERAVAIQNPYVEIVTGDISRPETLPPAMRDVDRLFLLSPEHPEMVQHQTNVLEAARRAGVRRVIKLSTSGASPDSPVSFFRSHGEIETKLAASGLEWTVLRSQFFMQNLLAFAPVIAAERMIPAPLGDGRIAMVDVRDVAACAAVLLTQPGNRGSRTYEITGPEAVSFFEVADEISKATGHRVTYVHVSPEETRAGLVAQGMPEWKAQGIVEVYSFLRAGQGAQVTGVVRDLTGREAWNLHQFARDHAFTFGA